MADGRCRRRADRRRQRRRKDEPRCIGPHRIEQICIPRDIAAKTAEGLCQRAFNDVDAVHRSVPFGNSAAMRSVHADGVNLVDIGQCTVALGQAETGTDGLA